MSNETAFVDLGLSNGENKPSEEKNNKKQEEELRVISFRFFRRGYYITYEASLLFLAFGGLTAFSWMSFQHTRGIENFPAFWEAIIDHYQGYPQQLMGAMLGGFGTTISALLCIHIINSIFVEVRKERDFQYTMAHQIYLATSITFISAFGLKYGQIQHWEDYIIEYEIPAFFIVALISFVSMWLIDNLLKGVWRNGLLIMSLTALIGLSSILRIGLGFIVAASTLGGLMAIAIRISLGYQKSKSLNNNAEESASNEVESEVVA